MEDLPEDHLLIETSLRQLIQTTDSGFNSDRRLNATGTASVSAISLLPQRGKLMAKAVVVGSQSKKYTAYIQFQGVVYNPPSTEDRVTFVAANQTYAIAPIDVENNNVKVRCTCLDFRFRFAMINSSDGSLYGPRPPIYNPVPNSNRPAANPSRVPGMCKHIKLLLDELQSGGLLEVTPAEPAADETVEPAGAPQKEQPDAPQAPQENNSEKPQ